MIVSEKAKMWVALIIGVLVAGLVAVQSALTDGITTSEWITIVITTLGALAGATGVYWQPNAPPTPAE